MLCRMSQVNHLLVDLDQMILGIFANEGLPPDAYPWDAVQNGFQGLADALAKYADQNGAGDLSHARLLAEVLGKKMALRAQLTAAYDKRDRAGLLAVAAGAVDAAELIDRLEQSWRRGWMRRNKPNGYEVLQLRLAQQAMRHRELARRVNELLDGAVASIPELDERPAHSHGIGGGWRFLASGSVSI